jgi:hypothetical protein
VICHEFGSKEHVVGPLLDAGALTGYERPDWLGGAQFALRGYIPLSTVRRVGPDRTHQSGGRGADSSSERGAAVVVVARVSL